MVKLTQKFIREHRIQQQLLTVTHFIILSISVELISFVLLLIYRRKIV